MAKARVMCIDDYQAYADMLAEMLERRGYEVKSLVVPFGVKEIADFDPDVIVLTLVRKIEALRSPISDFRAEVEGAAAYRTIAETQDLHRYPIILAAIAVEQREIPGDLPYVAFVEVPQRLIELTEIIDRVVKMNGAPASE